MPALVLSVLVVARQSRDRRPEAQAIRRRAAAEWPPVLRASKSWPGPTRNTARQSQHRSCRYRSSSKWCTTAALIIDCRRIARFDRKEARRRGKAVRFGPPLAGCHLSLIAPQSSPCRFTAQLMPRIEEAPRRRRDPSTHPRVEIKSAWRIPPRASTVVPSRAPRQSIVGPRRIRREVVIRDAAADERCSCAEITADAPLLASPGLSGGVSCAAMVVLRGGC